MKDAEISCVLIWDVCVCVSHAEGSYGGERAALLSSAWGSTADWRVKWSAAMLNCSPLSAVFSKHPPDDCGLCLPTWERHIFRRVCACSHTQPYPLPPHYRPHPLKHISDSRHCTSFLHSAHTHTLTRPRCKWNIYRSHASTRKHEHIYTQRDYGLQTVNVNVAVPGFNSLPLSNLVCLRDWLECCGSCSYSSVVHMELVCVLWKILPFVSTETLYLHELKSLCFFALTKMPFFAARLWALYVSL